MYFSGYFVLLPCHFDGTVGPCWALRRLLLWLQVGEVPPLTVTAELGGLYANDAPLLCGNRLRGGKMDFQAASDAHNRSRKPVSFAGPAVKGFFSELGRAHPLRNHFVNARPLPPFLP